MSSTPTVLGWVDLHAPCISTEAMVRSEVGLRRRIEAHCIGVEFDARHVDRHIESDTLTLCIGAPRDEAFTPLSAKDIAQHARALGPDHHTAWSHLRGHYALVHINAHTHAITLVTDRFGVRPLCWAMQGGKLWFSDRADAVAQAVGAPISAQAIYDYVYFHVVAAPRTIFEGVHRLEPARSVHVDAHGGHETVLWSPHFAAHTSTPLPALEQELRTLLAQSVTRELSAESVGAFLSGGTDSSTVAGLLQRARKEAGGPSAPTFSIGFAQSGYDEMHYARIAARHFGTDHHEYYVTADDLLRHIPTVAAHYDQPFGNSSALPAFCCALMAREQGVERLLAGDGGDELFGGNTRYAKQKVFGAYEHLPAGLRTAVLEPLLTGDSLAKRIPLVRKAASYVEQARVPMPERTETYNLLGRFGAAQVFTPALLAHVDVDAPLALQRRLWHSVGDTALVNRMLAYDWRFTLADTDLPKVTGTTALAGLEVGFPLLSDALVDFSLKLPPWMKVRGLTLRWFFKHALREFLPQEILRKKKHGFGLPFGPWLTQHAALRQAARDALNRLASRGLIRAQLVDDLFSSHLAEHAGYYGEMVWILMMLEHWLAAHAPGFALVANSA